MMKIDFLTLFPEMFEAFCNTSIIKRAVSKDAVELNVTDIRKFTLDKNNRVDDYTIGGGAGLIMKCQPALDCIKSVRKENSKLIYLSPKGVKFDQNIARTLAKEEHLIFLCGHYEGIDERIIDEVDMQISIGDYILTGGELPSMVVIDAVCRYLPNVLHNAKSTIDESFENNL